MKRTASVIRTCMWLIHVVTFSPLKGLRPRSESISSFFPQRFSRRDACLLPTVGPCWEGHLQVEVEENATEI